MLKATTDSADSPTNPLEIGVPACVKYSLTAPTVNSFPPQKRSCAIESTMYPISRLHLVSPAGITVETCSATRFVMFPALKLEVTIKVRLSIANLTSAHELGLVFGMLPPVPL